MPTAYELGHRPRIQKRGNRVTTISLRSGVVFRDVTKLLAPSTNLRKFGLLFGLEQKKAHFPFRLLDSVSALSEWKELPPWDHPGWQSELGGASRPTREEVDEAGALFREAGCSDLGDYLAAYLRLDVEILYRASQEWRRALADITGLDFVEVRKYTISSLSYVAGLKCWERNRRLGCFFPNNSQIYRLVRNAMRG